MPVERQLAEVEAGAEIGVDHRVPHVARHALQRGVAGDAGVVHQDLDRPDLGGDLLDRLLAGLEVAHVEAGDPDAGLLMKGRRRRLVAGIDWR